MIYNVLRFHDCALQHATFRGCKKGILHHSHPLSLDTLLFQQLSNPFLLQGQALRLFPPSSIVRPSIPKNGIIPTVAQTTTLIPTIAQAFLCFGRGSCIWLGKGRSENCRSENRRSVKDLVPSDKPLPTLGLF